MDFKAILDKVNAFLNDFPNIFRNAPTDEKAAYIVVFVGIFFLFVGLLSMIIL